MAPLDAVGMRAARRRLIEGLSGRVLEIGAGTGRTGRTRPEVGGVALDRDLASLKRARAQGGRSALVCADAAALPFKAGAFDAVVESLVFCSLPDPEATLGEIRRVLRPGGELRMADHVLAPGWIGWLQRALAPAWLRVTGGCHLDRDANALLAARGVRVERHRQRARGIFQEVVARL
jgi:ubiquinone/menaquinone biosynthesis C-methylase UbiE